jgi:hypothetical protein
LRDECLNREQLCTLTEARVVIEDYWLPIQPSPAAHQAGLPKPKTLRGHNPKCSRLRLQSPSVAAGQTSANNITNNQVSD